MTYTWQVLVDGSDVAVLVPETGRVDVGRTDEYQDPAMPAAVLELLSADTGDPRTAAWPEFTLGDHTQPSGFVDAYVDEYTGGQSRVTLGAPVRVVARTPSGFVDAYVDEYAGTDSCRIAGKVHALDYTWDRVRLTVIPEAEAWTRIEVGGTDDTTPIPQEADTVRVQRLCDEAGVSIVIEGPPGPDVIPIPVNTAPSPLWSQLQALARDCSARLWVDREGVVRYRTRPALLDDDVLYDSDTLYA